MSRRDLRKIIREIREASGVLSKEEQERAIRGRLFIALMDEHAGLTAPRFQRAKDPKDRSLPPEAEELWGEDRTQWRVDEEAASRVLDKFDEVMARPAGNTGDLTVYTSDLAYYEKERYLEDTVRMIAAMASQIERERDERGGG